MPKLNLKQERFCEEYIIDLNATKAAIRAGYSVKTAYSIGQKLLKKVEIQTKIQQLKDKRSARTIITQDKVIQELAAIGFAKATDYARVVYDKQGNAGVQIVGSNELSKQQISAISSIKESANGIEIKLCDKLKALELLGRHLGMFNDKLQLDANIQSANPFAELNKEELLKLVDSDG